MEVLRLNLIKMDIRLRLIVRRKEKEMNYYNEIKNELINNEINRKVKNYSINKNDLNTYYNVCQIIMEPLL